MLEQTKQIILGNDAAVQYKVHFNNSVFDSYG